VVDAGRALVRVLALGVNAPAAVDAGIHAARPPVAFEDLFVGDAIPGQLAIPVSCPRVLPLPVPRFLAQISPGGALAIADRPAALTVIARGRAGQ
jgi:hypothetical protein